MESNSFVMEVLGCLKQSEMFKIMLSASRGFKDFKSVSLNAIQFEPVDLNQYFSLEISDQKPVDINGWNEMILQLVSMSRAKDIDSDIEGTYKYKETYAFVFHQYYETNNDKDRIDGASRRKIVLKVNSDIEKWRLDTRLWIKLIGAGRQATLDDVITDDATYDEGDDEFEEDFEAGEELSEDEIEEIVIEEEKRPAKKSRKYKSNRL